MLCVVRIGRAQETELGPRIAALEAGILYPLGEDRFEIDHGADYFRFFRRLGRSASFAALEGDEVVGVLTAVEREIPCDDGATRTASYLCDLKAHPGRRGARVLGPLVHAFEAMTGPDAAGYGISMNAADGSNRLARLTPRLVAGAEVRGTLLLYSCDVDGAVRAAPLLKRRFGEPPRWLSLGGTKDIVLQSTGRPMPLLHAQCGRAPPTSDAPGAAAPEADAVHMFCAPADDPLVAALGAVGLRPTASATVLARGMQDVSFDFVRTSDI